MPPSYHVSVGAMCNGGYLKWIICRGHKSEDLLSVTLTQQQNVSFQVDSPGDRLAVASLAAGSLFLFEYIYIYIFIYLFFVVVVGLDAVVSLARNVSLTHVKRFHACRLTCVSHKSGSSDNQTGKCLAEPTGIHVCSNPPQSTPSQPPPNPPHKHTTGFSFI